MNKRLIAFLPILSLFLSLPLTPVNAAERKFQAEVCYGKFSATLQIKDGSAWKDVIAAQGWEAVASCPANNPYKPWAMADIAIGSTIRWHMYSPKDGAWDWYSSESKVQEVSDPNRDDLQELIPYVPCFETNKAPCIESFRLISDSGKITEAIPTGPTEEARYCFAGLCTPNIKIYQWKTPGIIHESKTELLSLRAYHFPLGAKYLDRWTEVDQTIFYIDTDLMNAGQPAVHFPDLPSDLVCGTKSSPELCHRRWSINGDYTYELTLRVLSTFDFAYANGEARDGNLTMKINENGDKSLTFSGKPVTVGIMYITELKPKNPNQKAADISITYITVFAHSTVSGWSQWLSRCDYGRGMSLWYSGELVDLIPMYLPDESALTLQVTSTHLNADRRPNVGTFNIVMPINLAKCLWGVDLSKAASASVSASYPELGIVEVITTSSKIVGDTFHVSAAGFHFSAPVIKVKLKQSADERLVEPEAVKPVKVEETTPVAVAAPNQEVQQAAKPIVASKKKTITCTKGKVTKKIVGTNPKCPAGFKTKASA